jgi:peptidyl-tRNA hydrolase, PTH1 family
MRLIIGLGNPGERYAHTRHNAGFDAADILSRLLGIPIKKLKCRAIVGEGTYGGERVALIKPQTFMNLSGLSVADALSWYKAEPGDTLILSDDIDLPLGTVRVRPHGGAGTHNGLRHILQCTGSDRFPRIRIGIGAPPPEWDLADWVLSSYPDEDQRNVMVDACCRAAEAAQCFLTEGIDKAMNRYNKKTNAEIV